jgi:hypothetical protein
MPMCAGGWAFLDSVAAKRNVWPLALTISSRANLASSPPFPYAPKQRRNRPSPLSGGSRLRYWLCPSLLSAHFLGRASKPLHFGLFFP